MPKIPAAQYINRPLSFSGTSFFSQRVHQTTCHSNLPIAKYTSTLKNPLVAYISVMYSESTICASNIKIPFGRCNHSAHTGLVFARVNKGQSYIYHGSQQNASSARAPPLRKPGECIGAVVPPAGVQHQLAGDVFCCLYGGCLAAMSQGVCYGATRCMQAHQPVVVCRPHPVHTKAPAIGWRWRRQRLHGGAGRYVPGKHGAVWRVGLS